MPPHTQDPKQRGILGFFGRNGQSGQSNAATNDRAAPAGLTNSGSRTAHSSQARTTTSHSSPALSSPLTDLPSKSPETLSSLSKHYGSHAPSSQSSISPSKLPLRHGTSPSKPQLSRLEHGRRNNSNQSMSDESIEDVIVLQPKSPISNTSTQRPARKPTEEAKNISQTHRSTSLKRKRDESASNQGTFPPPSFITISSGTSSSSSSPSASPSPCTKEPLQKHRLPQQIRDTAILDSESSAEELYPAQEPAQTPTVQGMITDSSESESDSSYLGDPGIAELVTGKFRRIHSKPSKTTKSARPDGKYSLANMVKQEKSKKDAQDRVLQYQKQMDSMEQAETSMSDVQGEQYLRSGKLDKSLLASMVDGNEDEENVDKVAQALDRAEVLRMEISWGFFENHKPACAPPPFPSSFTGSQSSQFNSLKDFGFRRDAFLTGFVEDWVLTFGLPRELSSWLWNSVIWEPRDDLARAYLGVLETSPTSMKSLLSPESLQQMLLKIGARRDFLRGRIKPVTRPINDIPPAPPPHISRLIEALARFSNSLSLDAKMCAIHGLIRLSLDCGVARDQNLGLKIDEAIVELIDSIEDSEADDRLSELAFALAKAIDNPILAHRIVSRIPDRSPRLHLLRRHLALYFFCQDERMLTEPLDRSDQDSKAPGVDKINRIVQELEKSPNFDVHDQDLDYRHVSARLSLLDIGVAGGFSRPSLLPQSSSSTEDTPGPASKPTKANPYKESSAALSPRSRKYESEKNEFNAKVDRLTRSLRTLGGRIIDPGAAHLTRTEAKGVLERVLRRIVYGVRIDPPKQQKQRYLISDFGVKKGSQEEDRSSMEDDDEYEDDENVADATDVDSESDAEDSARINRTIGRKGSALSGNVSRQLSNSSGKGKQVRFASPEKPTQGLTWIAPPPGIDGTSDAHPRSSSPAPPPRSLATDHSQRDPSSSLSDLPSSMFNSGSDKSSAAGVANEG